MSGTENKRPLLSICIPTYNRASILDETLFSIISDPDFIQDQIEIIVSDNNSTDNTIEIIKKYPLVNYYSNENNLLDVNFSYVLQHGNGEYLKLLNDTIRFLPGGLRYLLDSIKENLHSKYSLFFYNNKTVKKTQIVQCSSLGEFINATSFYSTWIGNFGIWRRDLSTIKDISLHDSHLLQVAWCYKIASKNAVEIYFNNYLYVKRIPVKDKTGYNVFKVFIENYLSFSQVYLKQKKISRWIYEKNKFTLFCHFISIRIIWLLFRSKNIMYFDNNGSWKIIINNYSYYPYFLIIIIFAGLWIVLKKCFKRPE